MSGRPDAIDPELDALLRLTLAEGLGTLRVKKLLEVFGNAAAVLEAPDARLRAVPGVGDALLERLREARRARTGPFWARAAAVGAAALTPTHPAYPELLRKVFDPPPILWTRPGAAASALPGGRPCVAVVGTRKATSYGRRMARLIGADLAAHGVVVVSGLAYGIDAAAHEGALEAGGTTVAVLGSGVDLVYPARHAGLAARILRSGALVSEFPPGTRPHPGHFPQRNRLISGMSIATVIVEAHDTGGALITARLAAEQDRSVFAVPGPIDSPASRGTNRLLAESSVGMLADVHRITGTILPAVGPPKAETVALSDDERVVCEALSLQPVHLEAVLEATGWHVSRLLATLLTLEVRGVVRQLAGRHFCLVRPVGNGGEDRRTDLRVSAG